MKEFTITGKDDGRRLDKWMLAEMPLLAAVVGALFVGVGAGLSARTSRAWASNGPISPPTWWCSVCR